MNTTCAWIPTSTEPVLGAVREFVRMFADTWVASLEFRIAVFLVVMQCSVMAWVTSMVREIIRTGTTVLCKLLACDSAALAVPRSRSVRTAVPAWDGSTLHKTGGGPPPGAPPEHL
jgi:hypothetical protein